MRQYEDVRRGFGDVVQQDIIYIGAGFLGLLYFSGSEIVLEPFQKIAAGHVERDGGIKPFDNVRIGGQIRPAHGVIDNTAIERRGDAFDGSDAVGGCACRYRADAQRAAALIMATDCDGDIRSQ